MRTRLPIARALAPALVATVLVAGCNGSDDGGSSGGSEGDPVPRFDTPPQQSVAWKIPADRVGDGVDELDGIVEDRMDETGVPGVSVAVVHRDEIVYEQGFGVREVGEDGEVDENTVFQLASLSKPLGASVVAGVVGDGTVAWDAPIVGELPDFALSDPWVTDHVTIEDMYSHRSGLPHEAGDVLEILGYDQAQVLERLRYLPLEPFRAVYNYSNFGVTTGGVAAAAAAGTTWPDLSRTRLYEPLGMDRTSSSYADFDAEDNKALNHQLVDGDTWEHVGQRQPDAQAPAGGASSTAHDMAQWMRFMLAGGQLDGRQVVEADALDRMLTPHIPSNLPDSPSGRADMEGLGIGIQTDPTSRVRFAHSGAFTEGASTTFILVPQEDLGIVVLTNGQPIGVPEAIAAEFLDHVEFGGVTRNWLKTYQEILSGAIQPRTSRLQDEDRPSDPAPALDVSAYAGTYANDFYGPVEVTPDGDGGLVVTAGPDRVQFEYQHWDGNTFVTEEDGERWAADFTVAEDGTVTAVDIEQFDDPPGTGVLTRG